MGELEQIEISETHSHIFRSKIKWIEDGEKNSKFFLSLEKRNYTNQLISQLNVNGKVIKDQKNIYNAQKNIYQNLYSEILNSNDISYKDSLDNFINKNPMKRLSDEEHMLCDRPITENKILQCLKNLNNETKQEKTDFQLISTTSV